MIMHPLGPAGGAGGVDRRTRGSPAASASARGVRAGSRPISPGRPVEQDTRRPVPRERAGQVPAGSATSGAAGVRAAWRQPLRGVGGVQRDVGAAGLEHAEQRDHQPADSRSTQTPTQRLRAHAQRGAGGGRAGWRARSSSRVGRASSPREPARPPPRACGPPAPRTGRATQAPPGASRRRPPAPRAGGPAPRRRQERQASSTRRPGIGRDRPPAGCESCRQQRSMVAASNRSVLYSPGPRQLLARRAPRREPRSNLTGRPASVASGSRPQSRGTVAAAAARVLQHEHHLEERRCGSGSAPRRAPPPASRTAGPGARTPPAPSPAPAPAARGTRVARQVRRAAPAC